MSTELTSAKPTNRQLADMRDLAQQTGTDCVDPGTAWNARREIDRLKTLSERQRVCEERFLQLTWDYGLPTPDRIERKGAAVRFLWTDRKVIVVVDLDDIASLENSEV